MLELDQPVVTAEKETPQQDPESTAPKRVYQEDWRKLALVIDRLSFYIFVIIGTMGTGIVFSQFRM